MATVDIYQQVRLPVVVWGAVLPDITYGNDYPEIHRVNGTMINQNEVAAQFMTGLGYQELGDHPRHHRLRQRSQQVLQQIRQGTRAAASSAPSV